MAHILVVTAILLSLLAPVAKVRAELPADPLDNSFSNIRANYEDSGFVESLA